MNESFLTKWERVIKETTMDKGALGVRREVALLDVEGSTPSGPATFTPGPWDVVAGDDYFITAEGYPAEFPHRFKSDDLGSALAYVGNRPGDFGEANARLIAAAPDLLEALEKCVLVFEQLADAGNYPAPLFMNGGWDFAAKAIKKARVEQR